MMTQEAASKPRLLTTSIFEILKADIFGGSYSTVAGYVREVRGPRFRAAPSVSVPIETGPGEEGQFDWWIATIGPGAHYVGEGCPSCEAASHGRVAQRRARFADWQPPPEGIAGRHEASEHSD
jgi:hypothetical protein